MEKRNQGITLIALIITIIIMLILVAVSIQVLINSGLFETSRNAALKTEQAYENEANLGEKVTIKEKDYNSVDEYVAEMNKPIVEPENIEDWEYTVEEDGTITITGYKGNDTEVVIPNYINGVPVTAINPKKGGIGVGENDVSIWDKQICDTSIYTGSGATWATTLITSVRVSEGIKYIENYSFFGTINLQNVVLPQSLIKIGYQAFRKCSQLAYITIPKSVQTMGAYAFMGVDSITINVNWKEGEKPEGWDDAWNTGNVTVNYAK